LLWVFVVVFLVASLTLGQLGLLIFWSRFYPSVRPEQAAGRVEWVTTNVKFWRFLIFCLIKKLRSP
jgi:hypothetical protein